MEQFRIEIENLMNEKNILSANIAEALGLQKSVMHRFLSGNTLEFSNALRVARFLDPINYLKIMDDYCKTIDKKIGILCAFEYASNFNRDELTKQLIEKHADKKGEIADYIKVYKTFLNRDNISHAEMMEFTKDNYGKTSSLELKTKILLIEASLYFGSMKFNTVHSLIDAIQVKIDGIANKFIKEAFKVRLSLYGANAELKAMGNVDKTVEYCRHLINSYASTDALIASAHHTLGHAYIFDRKEESEFLFKKASKLYYASGFEEVSKAVLENDLCLVKNIHGEEFDLSLTDGEELAHQYIVRGEIDKAIEVLDRVEVTPYSLLYRGIATRNFPLILEAHGIMMKAGDNFFIKIFERELYRLYNHKGEDIYEKVN
ncbi:AimR family lysis-lysogeny pheromone receptor [Shouchella patagoniensis]|uniref:AimR family lysis-lysogeny pheromone receptor n=1 Tax=Shouchella patagoniensis TaxID=228576 RepID=UPI0009959E27|nr:AimR family lysis-lysogeny pheromone receptor [Shouchella patagoniensis]